MRELLVISKNVKERWRSDIDKLFNGEKGQIVVRSERFIDYLNRPFVYQIKESNVSETLNKMKIGKVLRQNGVRQNGVTVEVERYLGNVGIRRLIRLFNTILRTNKMREEWRKRCPCPKI